MKDESEAPLFFATPTEFRAWLERHHDQQDVQWVGYYKKPTGRPSIDWPQSVDQALCFGWIDGLRRSIDEESYKIRFTPRRKSSHWSAKNLSRMPELIEAGLMTPPGLAVYEARKPGKEKQASFEQPASAQLPKEYEKELRSNPAGWAYWQKARPSYRKQVTWWVVSAKREATRQRRLAILVESCANGEFIPQMHWTKKKKPKKP